MIQQPTLIREDPKMDSMDKRLISEIQANFPLDPRPFRVLGQRFGLSEAEVLERIHRMKKDGLIHRIGAVFDSNKLGYVSTLVAAKVPPEKLDQIVTIINRYPGVTHNYLRDHQFNLWFTLIAPSQAAIQQIIDTIRRKADIETIYSLPAQRTFKIQVNFNVGNNEDWIINEG